MIRKLTLSSFKCFGDGETVVDFGDFTVLVGRNDTGKSSVLQALAIFGLLGRTFRREEFYQRVGAWIARGAERAVIRVDLDDSISYRATIERESGVKFDVSSDAGHAWTSVNLRGGGLPEPWMGRLAPLAPPYCFDLAKLRTAAVPGEIPDGTPLPYDGDGWPSVIGRFDHGQMGRLITMVTERLPHIREVRAAVRKGGQPGAQEVVFVTNDGQEFAADEVSDGAVLLVAYLTLALDKFSAPLLLIEGPENGIHPSQLQYLVHLFGELVHANPDRPTQIVMTTHSPHLLDWVGADQIRVFERDSSGRVRICRFGDDARVQELLNDGYQRGEAWFNVDMQIGSDGWGRSPNPSDSEE